MNRVLMALVLASLTAPAAAQETRFEADLRREREHIADSCDALAPKALGACAYTLATESPFHVALGSLAPQNGFAFGLAFNEHLTPSESWRLSWNGDAVAAPSGSWRAGAYMKMVHTPATSGVVVRPAGSTGSSPVIRPREFAVFDVFLQTISLETIDYFGPGQNSVESGRSVFGERQTLVGGSVIYPLGNLRAVAALRPALVGGITGRFVTIRSGESDSAPSIEQLYDDSNAPGLTEQRAFVEFREGIRFKPSIANGRLQFNYLLSAQQFKTSRETRSSFNRWTLDLQHEIPLYRTVPSTGSREFNGPNACAQTLDSLACPPVQWSRNRGGSITLGLVLSGSTTSDGNRVPFYFQPTLGGSDINGERRLAAYRDYRFRGSNLILLQEGLEHSIWGPLGAFVLAEQGNVTSDDGGLDFSSLATSTTVGVTLRAGGFPLVHLSVSWGREGHHAIAAMNSTLLGGSARPSLY